MIIFENSVYFIRFFYNLEQNNNKKALKEQELLSNATFIKQETFYQRKEPAQRREVLPS